MGEFQRLQASVSQLLTEYSVLNPNNVSINANADEAEIAYPGAEFTTDFAFPTSNSGSTSSGPTPGSPTTISSSHSSGLSTAAKAGIGAGVAVLVAILIGAVMFMRQRRRTMRELGPVAQTKYQHPYPQSYPMKDLEVSISHEELVANAAKPARGPIRHLTPSASLYSLQRDVKETSI
jgi:hypothetical protein